MKACDHPLYQTWKSMRQRCNNPKHLFYSRYGGRGIKVCERWNTFWLFVADVGDRPDGMTLDRKNVDGHYEPGNVKWATQEEQNGNRSCSRIIKIGRAEKSMAAWARQKGISASTLKSRLNAGWPLKKALDTPAGQSVAA